MVAIFAQNQRSEKVEQVEQEALFRTVPTKLPIDKYPLPRLLQHPFAGRLIDLRLMPIAVILDLSCLLTLSSLW